MTTMTAVTTEQIKELRELTQAGFLDCKKALAESGGDFEKAVEILRKKGIASAAKREGREAKEGLIGLKTEGQKGILVELNCETDFVAKTDPFQELLEKAIEKGFQEDAASLQSESFQSQVVETSAKTGEKLRLRRADLLQTAKGLIAGYLHSNKRVGVLIELETEKPSAEAEQLGKELAMQIAAMRPTYVSRDSVSSEWIEKEKEILSEQSKDALQNKPEPVREKILQGKLGKRFEEVCLLDQRFIKDDKKSVQQIIKEFCQKTSTSLKVQRFVRYELGGSS